MKLTKLHVLGITFVLIVAVVAAIAFLLRETRIPAEAEFEIHMERTACFGTCPIYTVTVNQAGEVVYVGEAFVQHTGEHRSQISRSSVDELRRALERIDFLALEDGYTDMGATDMPSAIIRLTVDGRTKTVVHYHGDFEAPEALFDLESEIDLIAKTAQWTEFTAQ